MLNTSNNDQYTMHMYCTLYSTSTSIVLSTLYSTKCIIMFCSAQFYWGGGLRTVQCRVYHYFLLGSILLWGGLKPPTQALMTRRPWQNPYWFIYIARFKIHVVTRALATIRAWGQLPLPNQSVLPSTKLLGQ